MNIALRRKDEVSNAINKIRNFEADGGVNRETLNKIKTVLLELAAKQELFPLANFPIDSKKDGNSVIYCLSKDDDHRFALYASTAIPGKGVHPHNHTTWAVIVGVHGDEHNIFYKRTDDLSVDGKGTLEKIDSHTVQPGSGVTLMPDDIHSIYTSGEGQTVHLHMYGLALDQLHERVMYNVQTGTYSTFPASQNLQFI